MTHATSCSFNCSSIATRRCPHKLTQVRRRLVRRTDLRQRNSCGRLRRQWTPTDALTRHCLCGQTSSKLSGVVRRTDNDDICILGLLKRAANWTGVGSMTCNTPATGKGQQGVNMSAERRLDGTRTRQRPLTLISPLTWENTRK